jgi:hypothetical protein
MFLGNVTGSFLSSTGDADINDNLTCGDIVVDEATGVISFIGATSATISTTQADLTLSPAGGKAIVHGADMDLGGYDIFNQQPKTSDAAADKSMIQCGQDAYSLATANTTGGTCYLSGGIGTTKFTFADWSQCAGKTVTVSGTSTDGTAWTETFTEGAGWTAATGNNETAASLASAITAGATTSLYVTGLSSAAITGVRPIGGRTFLITIATNAAVGCGAVANGADGSTYFSGGVYVGSGYVTGSTGGLYSTNVMIGANLRLGDATALWFGASDDVVLWYNTTQTPDALQLTVGADSNSLLVCEHADRTYDFAHPLQTNPTTFWQSANQSATEWVSLSHIQTTALHGSGVGGHLFAGGTSTTATITYSYPKTITTADSGADADPAATTINPADANTILLVCSDDDGCTGTITETDAAAGMRVMLVGSTGYTTTIADSDGVIETIGEAAMALDPNSSVDLVYSGAYWRQAGAVAVVVP